MHGYQGRGSELGGQTPTISADQSAPAERGSSARSEAPTSRAVVLARHTMAKSADFDAGVLPTDFERETSRTLSWITAHMIQKVVTTPRHLGQMGQMPSRGMTPIVRARTWHFRGCIE